MLAFSVFGATPVDFLTFVIAAAIVLAGAFGVVFSRNPVHSALSLVMTLFGVAVLFVEQHADFLAAVQVIVYAGAIVVLFLFVIMLLGVDREENVDVEPLGPVQRWAGLLIPLVGLFLLLFLAGVRDWATGTPSARGAASGSAAGGAPNVDLLGRSLFTGFLLPFEVTAVLLVIAVVGAVVLARRPPRAEQAEMLAEQRALDEQLAKERDAELVAEHLEGRS
ncbi:MAG TPA: NADH-quinone oxidoreductase subunit J [Acidimicrobiales bacterium]|nr:NADH-quinone oxidoreductase subunit J [Acidimicrobiales bacterium]